MGHHQSVAQFVFVCVCANANVCINVHVYTRDDAEFE